MLRKFTKPIMASALLTISISAQAQVNRSIVNPSFEQPFTGARAAALNAFFSLPPVYVTVDAGEIPGWETTHPLIVSGCPSATFAPAYNCTPIELWANNFNGVTPANGIVFAELNAYQNSKLFQNVCFATGETFGFNFAHRGRAGADRTQLQVGAANTVVMDVTTNTTGTGTINATAATGTSAIGIANGWTRYSGTYTYTGASGVQPLGFAAISSGSGGISLGNFLDDLNISLKPFVEFVGNTGSSVEGGTATPPKIKISGNVPPAGISVTVAVSGSATFTSDFNYTGATTLTGVTGTAATLTFTIPAGNYSDAVANNVFTLPINVIDDTVIENNETIILTLPPNAPATPIVVASTVTCGGSVNATYTHTIVDNDIDLQTTKTVSPATPQPLGAAVTYTITYENATPITPTIAPLTAHDANNITVTDSPPAGVTFDSWTCAAVTATCPATSGTGAISQTVNLPAGAKLTYVLQATFTSNTLCGQTVTNTSTIPTTAVSPSGANLTEGASVQGNAGYVFKANSASTNSAVQSCVSLSINKTNGRTTVVPGAAVTYNIVVGNAGPSAADGTVLRDPAVAGLSCTSITCTGVTGLAVCPLPANTTVALLQGAGIVLPTLPANTSVTFQLACNVTATGL
jgi:uncharacterized repeat protein (TIGR01451 family)